MTYDFRALWELTPSQASRACLLQERTKGLPCAQADVLSCDKDHISYQDPHAKCDIQMIFSKTDNAPWTYFCKAKSKRKSKGGPFISLTLISIKYHTLNLFCHPTSAAPAVNYPAVNKYLAQPHIHKAWWTTFSSAQPRRSFLDTKHRLAWRRYRSCERGKNTELPFPKVFITG